MSYLEIINIDKVDTKKQKQEQKQEWSVTFRDMLDGAIAIRKFDTDDPFAQRLGLGSKHAKQTQHVEGYIAERNGLPVVVLAYESIKKALSSQTS